MSSGWGKARSGLSQAAPRSCGLAAGSDSKLGSLPPLAPNTRSSAGTGALDDLFLTIGHRFDRVEPRRCMRDYVREVLAPGGTQKHLAAG